jgi:hypothetical protein
VVQRAIEALRELPPVRKQSVARIVAAAARSRAQDALPDENDIFLVESPARRRLAIATGIAAAALVVAGTATLLRATRHPGALPQAAASARALAVVAARGVADVDAAPVPTQFVFDGTARHVSLVGDFNNWDDHAAALEREPGSTLWSVTVPIVRGRHVYAFLVDSVWTIDKRAPVARDPDFGVTGSVILVGRP